MSEFILTPDEDRAMSALDAKLTRQKAEAAEAVERLDHEDAAVEAVEELKFQVALEGLDARVAEAERRFREAR